MAVEDMEHSLKRGRAVMFRAGDGEFLKVSFWGRRHRLARFWELNGARWYTNGILWAKRRPWVSLWRWVWRN